MGRIIEGAKHQLESQTSRYIGPITRVMARRFEED